MLLERARNLSARIAHYSRLKGTADEATQFETRANQFTNASEKLGRTRAALTRMKQAGVPVTFVPIEGDALAEKAGALRSAVQVDPNVLADPPFDLKHEFIARLLRIHDAAEREILDTWKRYVRENSDTASDDILNALSTLSQYRPIVAQIRECRSKIVALAACLPPDPTASVAQLQRIVEEHRKAWAGMTAEGIPEPVIAFLRACAAEGALLGCLTDEVRSWLESRNLLNAFRIKIK